MRMKFHYSWLICLCCTLLLICTMGFSTNAFAIYLPYIIAQGYSEGQTSALLSFRCFCSILGMIVVNGYYRYVSLSKGIATACLMTAVGFFIYSYANSYMLYILAAAICGFGYGLGSMIPVSILIYNWFQIRRGTALGICAAGTGICTIFFPPLIANMIAGEGIKFSFQMQAVFAVGVALLAFLYLKDNPEVLGLRPYGYRTDIEKVTLPKGCVAQEAEGVGTYIETMHPSIILMMIVSFLLGGIGTSAPGHFSVLFTSAGYSHMSVSLAISAFGVALTAAKLIYGPATDRFGVLPSTQVSMGILLFGCICCSLANGYMTVWMFTGTIFMGLGFAPATVGIPMWALDFSNSATYQKTLRWLQLAYSTGGMIISFLPGVIHGYTGDYRSSYIMFNVIILISTILLMKAYKQLNSLRCQI